MTLYRYGIFLLFWLQQGVLSTPVSRFPPCHLEGQSMTDLELRSSVPMHSTIQGPIQLSTVQNNITNVSNLSKRFHIREHTNIFVDMHYVCPISERSHTEFKWSVEWDSDDPNIRFHALRNIGGFPDEDKSWNEDVFPSPFTGSWWSNDYQELWAGKHLCRKSFTGHFEGQVDFQGVTVVFVDADTTGRQMPTITEYCRSFSKDKKGRVCTKWTISRSCDFIRALVSWPRN